MAWRDISKDDDSRIDAFLSGKLSADDCVKFNAWFSRKYGVEADTLKEATDDFFAGKDEPRMSQLQVARLRRELHALVLSEKREKEEEHRKVSPTHSSSGLGRRPGMPIAVASAEKVKERVYLSFKNPPSSSRALGRLSREGKITHIKVRSVADALKKLAELPLDVNVTLKHGPLTEEESRAVRAALAARRRKLRKL